MLPTSTSPADISRLEIGTPPELVAWALERFKNLRIAFTTAFGLEGCALIDMIARTGRPMRVLYLDTGFFFPETHALRERLMRRYQHLTFVNAGTALTEEQQERLHGPRLWQRDPDACCRLRKIEPMRRVLNEHDVWITSIRRDQTSSRAQAHVVEWDWRFDVLKFNPLANWTKADVVDYIRRNSIPYNELHDQGYPSIGCTHCTRPVNGAAIDTDSREGRWNGTTKTECGLHANGVTRVDRTIAPVAPPAPLSPADPPSAVEEIKRSSSALRGSIASTLASNETHFTESDYQLLKFHGIYQQDDRDDRTDRRKAGLDKAWMFMVRVAIPGGALTSEQWLALDALAEQMANGTLRLTTRQGVQFHGLAKGNLKPLIGDINRALLTTLAACGDIRRNVMATPTPFATDAHRTVQRVADDIARALQPATGAYHEIWVEGEQVHSSEDEKPDPFYGDTYLPRKFKVGVTLASDSSIDVYTQDCGLIGVVRNGRVVGFNLVVGGGLGMTHKKADTFARLASTLGFIQTDDAVDAVRVVGSIFKDFGNRSDRRHARLKYLVESWGLPKFRDEFQHRFTGTLAPPMEVGFSKSNDGLGRHDQGDGQFFYGIYVENGRVVDRDNVRMRSALREIATRISAPVRLTPVQNLLFHDLSAAQVDQIEEILRAHNVATAGSLSQARRHSMACPALPTCGLALADAERTLPDVIGAIEAELASLQLEDVELTIRMTGCPNGCARPYTADIGLVGRKPGVYHVFVGGGLRGDRVADLFADDVEQENIIPVLRPLLERFATERGAGEGLGDFYQRVMHRKDARTIVTGNEQPTREEFVQLRVTA